VFHRPLPPGVYAESWEAADRPEGSSTVRNGPLAGHTLGEVTRALGPRLLGAAAPAAGGAFPLLVKLIDAREQLSVQVHPDEAACARYGGEPKTEAWYVLDAAPGAALHAGFARPVDEAAFRQALDRKAVAALLHAVPVAAGDSIFIPAGRVHAIGAGCLIFEVQQNSNTTYRVYDWDRVGKDGQPRPLHVAQALPVIRWNDVTPATIPARRAPAQGNRLQELLACRWFALDQADLVAPEDCRMDGRSFHLLFAAAGEVTVEAGGAAAPCPAGATCLVPAALGHYRLVPGNAAAVRALRVRVP
jgi:mannose-6-phosphate isomerase